MKIQTNKKKKLEKGKGREIADYKTGIQNQGSQKTEEQPEISSPLFIYEYFHLNVALCHAPICIQQVTASLSISSSSEIFLGQDVGTACLPLCSACALHNVQNRIELTMLQLHLIVNSVTAK